MIRVDALCKSFREVEALADVSFEAASGEVIGVLGLNGAGKSTLLRILAGELVPSSGRVAAAGLDLAAHSREARARTGYLPEHAPLYREMRVRDFLRFMGRINGMEGQALADRVLEVARVTHIEPELDRVIGELSMGYRKRVGIAQAILHRPALVILDEPISALDPAEIVGMRSVVRSLGGAHTVLVSSHILSEIHETCDRILVLHDGRLVAEGSEAELRDGLGATRSLSVELRGSEDAARAALPAGVSMVGAEHITDAILRIELSMGDDQREAVVAALVNAGLGVRAVADGRTDLEAVFLSLVAEGAR